VREFLAGGGHALLPGIFRRRRADWHQGLAAAGLAVFSARHSGTGGHAHALTAGILLLKDTPLRLTPTSDAQVLARLPDGEAARIERERGGYLYVRASNAAGWIERTQFGSISSGR